MSAVKERVVEESDVLRNCKFAIDAGVIFLMIFAFLNVAGVINLSLSVPALTSAWFACSAIPRLRLTCIWHCWGVGGIALTFCCSKKGVTIVSSSLPSVHLVRDLPSVQFLLGNGLPRVSIYPQRVVSTTASSRLRRVKHS